MVTWITNDIISFLTALVLVGFLIPQILVISFRKNLFDKVDARKVHKGVVPRLGGVAFFPAILFSMALVAGINLRAPFENDLDQFVVSAVPICYMICAVLLMFLIGITDDLVGARYKVKLAIQILSSLLIIASGMTIDNFQCFLWLHELPLVGVWIVTSFVVVYVVNAVNLIDGIDGLASGLCGLAFIFYAVIFYLGGNYLYSILCSASLGALVPFFYYNVFGSIKKQKKIFMGDTGALTTGMILAFCFIAMLHVDTSSAPVECNSLVIAISPLVIPCFDVVRVSLHRVRQHRNPFLPDKSHIHHKLLALGLTQHSALCLIVAFAIVFILLNMLLSPYMNPTVILCLDVVVWTSVNIALTRAIKAREKRLGESLYR
ncbi:MAG: undecaprenyl/decaprenyl-phosphate alpha-N-acetylglucosaminyl 1-phosphate transferase [Bacteroides sp.]|nr:undecaprenyl/decaprenyl-phosphate alpha-N-acetylglucosaminyl 1-phosphate transferase [Bacteroides sp.]